MTTYGLTERMAQCLKLIQTTIRIDGIPPSYRELQAALGLKSVSSVYRLIADLEKRGHVRRIPHAARSIAVVERNS